MKKTGLIFISVLLWITGSDLCNLLYGQDLPFVKPDETFRLYQQFALADTITIVLPDVPVTDSMDARLLREWNFWGPKAVIKKESQLKTEDLTGHLHILGPIHHFHSEELLQIPVDINQQGFSFMGISFDQRDDALYYISDDARRFYTVGNTYHSTDQLKRHILGAYPFYIFRDNVMYYSGFISHTGGRDSINDLEKSRKAYFSVSSTKYFDLNFAGSFDRDSIHQRASNELDTYIEDLAGKLGSDTKNLKKLRTYIYINRTDLQEFLGVPSVMQMFGLNVNDVIHGYTFDLDILKHEAAHNFILQKIGNNTNVFFIEGFRQFTEYLFDEEKFGDDIEITSVHLDLLTHDLLMGDVRIFFNNPQSYAISGVFVIFMIDKMGLENFKELYSGNNLDTDLKQKYGCNLEQLMDEFKATFNL